MKISCQTSLPSPKVYWILTVPKILKLFKSIKMCREWCPLRMAEIVSLKSRSFAGPSLPSVLTFWAAFQPLYLVGDWGFFSLQFVVGIWLCLCHSVNIPLTFRLQQCGLCLCLRAHYHALIPTQGHTAELSQQLPHSLNCLHIKEYVLMYHQPNLSFSTSLVIVTSSRARRPKDRLMLWGVISLECSITMFMYSSEELSTLVPRGC